MLLNATSFANQLNRSLSRSTHSLLIFSAFIKADALKHIAECNSLSRLKTVRVVARWQKRDLLAGASDLEVYELCRELNWEFAISLNLHGKLFVIDNDKIFLGSANLTRRGLHLGLIGNHEFGTQITAADADLLKIEEFIRSESVVITDNLYELISNEINATKQLERLNIASEQWSTALITKLATPVTFLWVRELPKSSPNSILSLDVLNDDVVWDCELFNIDFDYITSEELQASFRRSRVYQWLTSQLKNGETINFGGLTKRLHNSLLDDPKPYRVQVKDVVRNLYAWAKLLDNEFEVTRPRHSQLLRKL